MKLMKVISAIAVCLLAAAAFASQAKADAAPSGFLDFACSSPTNTCTGTVSGGQGGPWSSTGVGNLKLGSGSVSFPVFSNGGDELGDTYTLAFDTNTSIISITDSSDGDFNLTGVILNVANSFNSGTKNNTITLSATLNGFPADGPVKFNIDVASGNVISADMTVVTPTPEPASLLLLGSGLLGLGGAVRRRLFHS